MVLWNSINQSDETLPLRFQIPRGRCEYGKSSPYNLVTLEFDDEQKEFLEWFKDLEKRLIGPDKSPIDSRVKENTIHVKYVDGFTQVFDESNNFLIDGIALNNTRLDCLVEIDKVYGPLGENKSYGITCKIFQVRVTPGECYFL